MKSKFGMDLTKGPVFQNLIVFVIPIMLSGILQQLYNAADTIVVGQFAGDAALAAVGSTAALTNLILNLFLGLSIGANVVCANFFGAGDRDSLQRAIHTAILLSVLSGVFLAVTGSLLAKPMLRLMGTPEDVLAPASLYMRVIFLGAPVGLLYNFGAGILRAGGDAKRPLYILAAAGVINIALNLFCVVVLKLGVLGVAIGTIAAQTVSAVTVMRILIRSENEFQFSFSKMRFYRSELLRIVKIGVPAGLNGIMFSLSNVILQSTLNTFGKTAVAGNTAATTLEIFFFLLLSAVEQGIVSFTAQNIGAGAPRRAESSLKFGLAVAFAGIALMELLVLPNGRFFLGIFTPKPSVIDSGMIKVSISCLLYFTYIPSVLYGGALRGMGYSATPAVLNALFICLSRVVWIYTAYPLHPTLEMLYYVYPISWVLSSAAHILAYHIVKKKVFTSLATPE